MTATLLPRATVPAFQARIPTATDVDWFRFTTASSARSLVTLGHLAADYVG